MEFTSGISPFTLIILLFESVFINIFYHLNKEYPNHVK